MKIDNTKAEQQAQDKAKPKSKKPKTSKSWAALNVFIRIIGVLWRIACLLEGDAE